MIVVIALLSMHAGPSFFERRSAGIAQGPMLSWAKFLLTSSFTCRRSSSCSFRLILYVALFGMGALGEKSMQCWIFIISVSPRGTFLESCLRTPTKMTALLGKTICYSFASTTTSTIVVFITTTSLVNFDLDDNIFILCPLEGTNTKLIPYLQKECVF